MAKMIPDHGPHHTESKGEIDLYWVLKKDLPDDYTVIHSLPWLCAAVTEIGLNAAPTGEIDLLVIHPDFGVLAIEVKSGKYHIENSRFFHDSRQYCIDPIGQTRKNVHGLARWLGNEPSLRLKIGYGFIFPDSDFRGLPTTPGMYDTSTAPPQPLYIDFLGVPDVAQNIVSLMIYWKAALSNPSLGVARAQKLIDYLTPTIDGAPQWGNRILFDNKVWLKLTDDQSTVVRNVLRNETSLITGWPGTGKTLVVIEAARKLTIAKKRVLVVSYNNQLTEYIRRQLKDYTLATVLTWHSLCTQAARQLGRSHDGKEWLKTACVEDLKAAIEQELLQSYDALVVDESQALTPAWCEALSVWFQGKHKAFFCDETQVFPFERGTVSLQNLSELLGVTPFPLTIILRMPKAVTDILSEVVPPKLQHSSPRHLEEDTALEVITLTPCEDLVAIKRDLINSGVSSDDIVILTGSYINRLYFDFLHNEQIATKTIAKFRGLEAPIILIIGAEQLGTAELFSAYSRATTKCIAIYHAHNRYWLGADAFQTRLQNRPESRATLLKAQQGLRIRSLIEKNNSLLQLNLQSLNIFWENSWDAWLIEIDEDETPILLWIAYLSKHFVRPVFFWYKDTIDKFYYATQVTYEGHERTNHSPVSLQTCEKCDTTTPHTYSKAYHCTLCLTMFDVSDEFGDDTREQLNKLDKIITNQLSKEVIYEFRQKLPLAIAAAGAFLYAARSKLRTNALNVPLPDGKNLYVSAFAFAQSRIAIYKIGEVMEVNLLADEIYDRFESLWLIKRAEWRSSFANAMGQFFNKGYLVKIQKGFYTPAEDDVAPVPWHLLQKGPSPESEPTTADQLIDADTL